MKLIFEKIISEAGSSFASFERRARYFHSPYHFHPEYEITLITASSGTPAPNTSR